MKKGAVYKAISALLAITLSVQAIPVQGNARESTKEGQAGADPAIAYFVDAGDQNPSTVNEGEVLGIYNSVTDQIFGQDSVTGKNWGVNENTEADALSGYADGMDKKLSYRCGETGYDVEYRFELPEGIYDIETGIPHYPSWGPRILNVTVSDAEQETILAEAVNPAEIPEGEVRVIQGSIELQGGELTVSYTKNQAENWDPLVSYLCIYDRNGAKQSLDQLVAEAEAFQEQDYTQESYKKLRDAMENAKKMNLETHTSKQICQAREELQKAIDGLISQEVVPREDTDPSIAYFVDAGAYDPRVLQGEDLFGTYNGVVDQIYGVDPVTGYSWGYEGQTVPYYNTTPGMTKEESCRFGDTGWDFGYRFALAKGTYDVEIYVPKEVSERVFDIFIADEQGERKLTQNPVEADSGPHVIYGQVNSAGLDSQVAIDFRKPDISYWDPVVSYLVIYDNEAALKNFQILMEEIEELREEDYRPDSWQAFRKVAEEAENIQISQLEYPGRQLWEEMKKIKAAMSQLKSSEELAIDFFADDRTGGGVPDRTYIRQGEAYVIPEETPVRKGYEFLGWSLEGTLYQAGETLIMPDKDVVFLAQWARRNTVSFGRGGGSGVLPESFVGVAGESMILPEADLRKIGYTFTGWSDGEAIYRPGETYVIPDRDITLVAVWKQNPTYTISFAAGGGSGALPANMVNQADEMVIIPDCRLVRDGYRFTGWISGEKVYQPGAFFRMPEQDMLLIAGWEKEPAKEPEEKPDQKPEEPATEAPETSYSVSFLSEGKTVQTQNVKKGDKAACPEAPKRRGYAFQGWYLGSRKYSFTEAVTDGLTLTAKWKKIKVAKGSLLSVKSKKKGRVTLKIKKISGADGYQILFAVNRKFRKGKKQKLTQSRSLTIKKLKKGKTYYFKVRAYRVDSSGKKVYGAYSAPKRIQVKR